MKANKSKVIIEDDMNENLQYINTVKIALNSASFILLAVDQKGVVTTLEGGGLNFINIAAKEIIGKSVFKIKNIPFEKFFFKEVLKGRTLSATSKVEDIIFETFYSPIRDQVDNIVGCSSFAIDITKTIELERDIENERRRVNRILKLNALAGMANGMAHEINNPLAVISGYSQQVVELLKTILCLNLT